MHMCILIPKLQRRKKVKAALDQLVELSLCNPKHPSSNPSFSIKKNECKKCMCMCRAQVVGWPPVRSFRKNMFAVQKSSVGDQDQSDKSNGSPNAAAASFVKVSMDGAPYLRKVDLKMYKSYPELSDSLGKMFSSFTIGN